jgi:hypothetical protein
MPLRVNRNAQGWGFSGYLDRQSSIRLDALRSADEPMLPKAFT